MYSTKQKQVHRYGRQTNGYQWGEGRTEGQIMGMGLLCIKQIRNKDKMYSTGKYSHYLAITVNGILWVEILNH